jgi:antagonist of KipI
MSIKIIKKGLSDSIQDQGRYGYQHLGIQPNGYMDFISAWLGNYILNNDVQNPVIELHFPTSQLQFEKDYTICITGANFVPVINDKSVELNTPIQVRSNDILSMLQPIEGKTSYLAIQGEFMDPMWLNSHSYNGKRLDKDQMIQCAPNAISKKQDHNKLHELIEQMQQIIFDNHDPIRILPGPGWNHLTEKSLLAFLNQDFKIAVQANRMGFNLTGPKLELTIPNTFLSSAVTKGTLQLLPNGDIIVLMADHQTIGGYANLGQIILVDLPRFTQMKPDKSFHFELIDLDKANKLYRKIYDQFHH